MAAKEKLEAYFDKSGPFKEGIGRSKVFENDLPGFSLNSSGLDDGPVFFSS